MEHAISRTGLFKENFKRRVGDKNVPRAALWLFFYSTPAALLIAAIIVFPVLSYSPELAATIETEFGQINPGWFSALVFCPLVESLLLAGIITFTADFGAGKLSVFIGATLLAGMHSLQIPLWGVTVFSIFLIQSYAFFHTYEKGFWRAFMVISLAHAMNNAFALAASSFG